MSVVSPKRYLAKVQAKDEQAKVELNVTAETTLGELLRYWDWRSVVQADAGFLIDISVDKVEPAKDPEIAAVPTGVCSGLKGTLKRPVNTPPDDIPAPKRLTAPTASSSSKQVKGAGTADVNVENNRGESSGSVPKHEVDLKLDPKAGCRIDIAFPDGTKIPMHIIGTNTLEKIGRSACKIMKMDFERMKFKIGRRMHVPYQAVQAHGKPGSKKQAVTYARIDNICSMTADDLRLGAGSVIQAKPSNPKSSVHLIDPKGTSAPVLPAGPRRIKTMLTKSSASKATPKSRQRTLAIGSEVQSDETWFKIEVMLYSESGEHRVPFEIQNSTCMEKVCQAACEELDVEYESIRFIYNGLLPPSLEESLLKRREPSKVLLIRDPKAQYVTAADWDLEAGDVIEGLSCQCGC